jgi:heme oxygenase
MDAPTIHKFVSRHSFAVHGKEIQMTDNEIIKDLKECLTEPCSEQAYINAIRNALFLINRLQAENEKFNDGCSNCIVVQTKSEIICELHEQIEYWQRGYNDLRQEIKTAKAEAIKEVLEWIESKSQYTTDRIGKLQKVVFVEDIDNIKKEMTGE